MDKIAFFWYHKFMIKKSIAIKTKNISLPLFVEKDEDGFYVVECPLFEGCYTQGKSLDDALTHIREVLALVLEEKKNKDVLKYYHPKEISLHTITL